MNKYIIAWSEMEIKQFEQFFNNYYIPVLQYCIAIVRNREDAEDIVQQAFVTLWVKKETINIHTSARAYLYKSVYNSSLDFLKHEAVKRKHAATEMDNKVQVHVEPMKDDGWRQKIELAINNLPEQCGKVFRMSRMENKKYRETATILNISEKTVENHMGKALKLLRGSLKELLVLFFVLIKLLND